MPEINRMKLLIISHTPHYLKEGQVVGWGSTIMEIDQLAKLFTSVTHLAPLHQSEPPQSSLPYLSPKVRLALVRPAGGERLSEKFSYLWRIPRWISVMKKEIENADAVHIRCPAGISLVGLLVHSLSGKGRPCWVKYAGNWQPEGKDPLSYKLQRMILKRKKFNRVVTVNGKWEGQPNHVVSFVNPSFSESDWILAQRSTKDKLITTPLELLFVGRVEEEKGMGRLIQISSALNQLGINFHVNVIGDGPRRSDYEKHIKEKGLTNLISFIGWKSRAELAIYYSKAHIILLPSTASEGWPKVLSEAMAFGVVPLASTISSIPYFLNRGNSGKVIGAKNIKDYVSAIIQYQEHPEIWKQESLNAGILAENFTYEKYLQAVQKIFGKNFKIDLRIYE